jgi:hypothetical protein
VALIAPGGGLTYFQDFTPNASGAILDGGSPALLFGNDVISAGGSTGVTWWGVAIYINGIPAGETPYTFNSNTSYDLTTAIPNTTNPVIPTPTGDSTYFRLDGGNNPMTGQVAAKNGTAASPGLAFASDLTTGFARQAASVIGGAIAGTFRWLLSATGELLGSGGAYGWSSNADPSLAAGDSFLARISAKILGIGSTNGGTDGELRLAKVNKVTITQPATGSTLTIADGKTATVNNSLTLAGTDGTTQTFQASDTIVGRATTDTLTNKTIGAGGLAGLTPSKQIFTGNGTFTIPAGVTAVKVTLIGGGGGGGGSTAANNGGGGGSGGAAVKWLSGLTPANTIAVTIGGAGAAGLTGASGGAGGNSTIASGTQTITTVTAFGGAGGLGNGAQSTGGTGGAIGTNGDVNLGGSSGFDGIGISGGPGGGSMLGGGAPSSNGGQVGNAALSFGGGGGGAGSGGNRSGGAGAAGIVIFEWII